MVSTLSSLSILVVDADREWLDYTCGTLKGFGIRDVEACADGGEAVQRIVREDLDVIFVDAALEPEDGLSLVRKIRSMESGNRGAPPIVFLTGEAFDHVTQAWRKAGADDFLVKPFTAIDLMGHLMSVIERPAPFVRTTSYFGPDRRTIEAPRFDGADRRKAKAEAASAPPRPPRSKAG